MELDRIPKFSQLQSDLLKIIILVTCSLSVIGSLTIIASYVFYKTLRTSSRLILVHLSIMDLGVAVANLVGTAVDFNSYYLDRINGASTNVKDPEPSGRIDLSCKTQAALAVYFTAGSFMWTLSMAVFLYFKVVYNGDKKLAKRTLYISTALCYILPLFIVMWKVSLKRLGFSPFNSEGWCGAKTVNLFTGERYILMDVLSYNIWVLLIYTLVPVLYIAVLLHLRMLKQQSALVPPSSQYKSTADIKLLLIPFAFLLLRIWSTINTFLFLYLQIEISTSTNYALVVLSGIGDSGQGFVNSILFVVLTKKVRQQLFCKRHNSTSEKKCTSSEQDPLMIKDGRSIQDFNSYKVTSISDT